MQGRQKDSLFEMPTLKVIQTHKTHAFLYNGICKVETFHLLF